MKSPGVADITSIASDFHVESLNHVTHHCLHAWYAGPLRVFDDLELQQFGSQGEDDHKLL